MANLTVTITVAPDNKPATVTPSQINLANGGPFSTAPLVFKNASGQVVPAAISDVNAPIGWTVDAQPDGSLAGVAPNNPSFDQPMSVDVQIITAP